MAEGKIILDRSIRQHWIWSNSDYLKWWVDMLMMANWEDGKVLADKTTLVNLKRGEFIASRRFLAKRWGVGEQSVRTFLATIEEEGMISTQKVTQKVTKLTICNYDTYQSFQPTSNPQATHKQPTSNPQATQNKEEYNNKQIQEEENNITHTSACAYTREGGEESSGIAVLPIESLYNEYRAEIENGTKADQFIIYYKNNHGYDITREQILSYLESFQAWLGQQGITHKTMIDYRKHFSTWMQRQVKDKIKQQQYGRPNQTMQPDRLAVKQPTDGSEYSW